MTRRLLVVAGRGALAPHVIRAARAAGDILEILKVADNPEVDGRIVEVSDMAGLRDAIVAFGATHLVAAGGVDLTDRGRERMAAELGVEATGDVDLSVALARLGVVLLGAHEVAPDLLADIGRIAGPEASAAQVEAGQRALDAARAVGAIDLGQAVVVAGRRVIAAEDAGGTDELLSRVERYRGSGLVGDGRGPLVLGKAAKPGQPRFIDLPAIGPQTVLGAAAAGISAIAVEARRSLVLGRDELVEAAAASGIAIFGLRDNG